MNAPPLAVMSTLAVMGPLRDLIGPQFEAREGRRLQIQFDPTNVLLAHVRDGARADVLVAVEDSVRDLEAAGVLMAGSACAVARTSVGLACRPGAPPMDISTPQAFVGVLRAASSLVYSRTGASGVFFDALIERLGVADEIRAKSVIIPKGFTAEVMMAGEADLAVQQISELMVVPGAQIIGPFPDPYGSHTCFTAALFRDSAQLEVGRRFLAALTGPDAAAAYGPAGLVPAAAGSSAVGGPTS